MATGATGPAEDPMSVARSLLVRLLLRGPARGPALAGIAVQGADEVRNTRSHPVAAAAADAEVLGAGVATELHAAHVELDALVRLLEPSAPRAAAQLREVGRVALKEVPDQVDARAWSAVDLITTFDPEALGARAAEGAGSTWRWLSAVAEFSRNAFVLLPVTFTWIGLGKAAAVYASCRAVAGAPGQLAQTPFLRLWETGFQPTDEIVCETSRGTTYGLPLNSFGEVVFADFIVLFLLIVLTVVVHFFENLRATAQGNDARTIADQLRGLLTYCAVRLRVSVAAQDAAMLVLRASENLKLVARQFQDQAAQLMIRSEQGTGELVLRASGNLASVATRFEENARQMMETLQQRSTEAEQRLAELGRQSVTVSSTALAAVNKLEQVLQAVAESAAQLTQVSVNVRDELTSSAAALRTSVAQSGTQLQGVASRIDEVSGGLVNVDRTAKELLGVWQRADRALEETRSGIGSVAERLEEISAIESDARERLGAMADRSAASGRTLEQTRTAVESMSEQVAALNAIQSGARGHLLSVSERFGVLDEIRRELVAIKIEQQLAAERQGLPQPAWRLYGYMQAAQIGLLALVLGSVLFFGIRALAAPEATPLPSARPAGLEAKPTPDNVIPAAPPNGPVPVPGPY